MKSALTSLFNLALLAALGLTPNAQAELTPYNEEAAVIENLPNEEGSEPAQTTQPQSENQAVAPAAKVVVVIDKGQQLIAISSPNTADMIDGMLYAPVSTGGGLKIPNNPNNPKPPYCATTPDVDRMVIRARPNQNIFASYQSQTFSDGENNPIDMPYAIHIKDGIFLHQVPAGKERLLGQNVSGGCIRLPSKVARFLYQEMMTYGEIELTIGGGDPKPVKGLNDCDDAAIASATANYRRTRAQHAAPQEGLSLPQINPLNNPVANFFKSLVEGI